MSRSLILTYLFLLLSHYLYPAETIIRLDTALNVYTLDYPFYDFQTLVGRQGTNKKEIILDLEKTTCLYIDYGPYTCYFFAEPGYSYEPLLPDISNMDDSWKFNPYFRREKYQVNVITNSTEKGNNELNQAILEFNRQFEPFIDKQILRYYDPLLSAEKRDSFIQANYGEIEVSDKEFYRQYIFFKKGILDFSTRVHDLDKLINEYLVPGNVDFGNPAYRELFRLLLQDYFQFLSEQKKINGLLPAFINHSIPDILEETKGVELMQNQRIAATVLLNETYNAYYSGFYDKIPMAGFCDSIIKYFPSPKIRSQALAIKDLFIRMETGYPVPEFEKTDLHNDTVSIKMFENKYVYLGFIDSRSSGGIQELEIMKYLHGRYGEYISVICVIVSDDGTGTPVSIEYDAPGWHIVPVKRDDRILRDYKIRALPVFYLLDKEGYLLHNPAAAPSENFEYRLFELLRSRHQNQ